MNNPDVADEMEPVENHFGRQRHEVEDAGIIAPEDLAPAGADGVGQAVACDKLDSMPNNESLTNNPFFVAVVAAIEKKIAEGDRIARANHIALSDAQILALLTKAAGGARGKAAKTTSPRLPRDQILTALAEQLSLLRASIFERKIDRNGAATETPLSDGHWNAALKIVQKSIRLGTGHLRGSRSFLDSLSIFMARAASAGGKR